MVTFADLRDARLTVLAEAAEAWRLLARGMDHLANRVVGELTGPLRNSGWSGDAANLLFGRLDLVDDECELAALQARMVSIVLGEAVARLTEVQKRLQTALDACERLGLSVTDSGRVLPPPASRWYSEEGREHWERQRRDAEFYSDVIARIVADATEDDEAIRHALDRLNPETRGAMDSYEWKGAIADAQEVVALLGLDESPLAKRDDPQAARAWWDQLDDDQRQLYLAAYPELVGSLDGLPAASRDEANRLALRAELAEVERSGKGERDRLVKLLDRLEASEYGPPNEQLLLLGFDNAGDGKAVVAVGNPDTARHTAVLVPGVGTELDDMPGQIDRAREIQRAAYQLGGPTVGGVSVIAWLGYDTPGIGPAAIGHRHAEQGAPALDSFIDGLRAAHDPGPSHLTVIGHSYGSTVIGEAASHGDGLAVDDIIAAGSPGMHVDTAEELQIDPRHVWAGLAERDLIGGILGSIPGIHDNEPTDKDFGANRYHVDTSGHSSYWTPGSESLRNQARIVIGQYEQVSLDHGKPPR